MEWQEHKNANFKKDAFYMENYLSEGISYQATLANQNTAKYSDNPKMPCG